VGTPDARVTTPERSAADDLREVAGFLRIEASWCKPSVSQSLGILADRLDRLADGQLVVLHPGQHVVEWGRPLNDRSRVVTPLRPTPHAPEGTAFAHPAWIVVASNAQERTL
jgi:hypothetical protein